MKKQAFSATVLDEADWDFSYLHEAPASEQQLACYYEYARESDLIRFHFSRFFDRRFGKKSLIVSHPILLDLWASLSAHGEKAFVRPWKLARKVVADRLLGLTLEQGGSSFGRIDARTVEHWALRPNLDAKLGHERFMARIDWNHGNGQLGRDFASFLKASRPGAFPNKQPRGKHKKKVWLDSLDWLAVMRLLHNYTPSELPVECPAGWKRFARRSLFRNRKFAVEKMNSLFPFLCIGGMSTEEREKAIRSYKTKGGRFR